MSGMFRSMVGGKAPQWPTIPWHVTDAAAALPPDHAKYAAGEHTKCVPRLSSCMHKYLAVSILHCKWFVPSLNPCVCRFLHACSQCSPHTSRK